MRLPPPGCRNVERRRSGIPGHGARAHVGVTDSSQVSSAVEQSEAWFSSLDVLVNNAGYGCRAANFFGPIVMIKAVLPGMRGRRTGAIVNISSIGARITPVGSGYYSATKAALDD
jgi:NAD(P)-dependent dehydrogenase (short-subunit alcohol dehydrogenase family)